MYKVVRRKPNSEIKYPYYSKEALEILALKILAEYDKNLVKIPSAVPIEDLIEQFFKLDIDYKHLSQDNSILGLTAFETGHLKVYDPENSLFYPIEVRSGTIIIDNSLLEEPENNGRYRFTCGHELSHWELHKSIFFSEVTNKNNRDINHIKCLNRDIGHAIERTKTKNLLRQLIPLKMALMESRKKILFQ